MPSAMTSAPSESFISLPPGPRASLRATHALIFRPFEALGKWRERFGSTFTINRLGSKVIITGDPELIQQLYSASDPELFVSSIPESFDVAFGPRSLLSISGKRHVRERKVMTPAFHGDRLHEWAEGMALATRRAFARDGETTALERTKDATLEVIIRVIFGVEDESRIREFSESLLAMVEALRPGFLFTRKLQRDWLGLSPFARFRRANQTVETMMLDQISRTRANLDECTHVLSDLLRARYDDGSQMDDAAICDHLRTLLIGGHETTAVISAWAIYFALREPHVLARMREEFDALGPNPSAMAVAQLPYLSAVIDETLRIRPISADSCRMLARPWEFGQWRLPAGAAIIPSALLVHFDPELWPEPHVFRPERFLDNQHHRPQVYFPFGGGSRRCIGATFARFEACVIVGTLLRERRVELLEREVGWVRAPGNLQPRGGVRICVG